MLKITAPIKTVINPDMAQTGESFARRIIANYDQMQEFITREDLFHVVSEPPEIFLLDSGVSSFLSETEIHNTQLKKVEIINNLMNRILVSADGALTYQDEVYITNVLHKLGIRDERTFMKNVYELTRQTKETNALIENYWQNRQELSQMIAYYRNTEEGSRDTINVTNTEEVLHLHEDVFKRWMTAAVYRIQQNFRTSSNGITYVDGDSYRMTEEMRLSEQILLQRLRESVRGESVPLIYRHENYYEVPGDEEEDLRAEAISEQIASAVLLSLTDNLYQNITNRTERVEDRFYRTEEAFYGAASNVFERMENNTAFLISQQRSGDVINEITNSVNYENRFINEIVELFHKGGDEFNTAFFEEAGRMLPDMRYTKEGDTTYHVSETSYGDSDRRIFEGDVIDNRTYGDTISRISRAGDEFNNVNVTEESFEGADISHITEGDTNIAGDIRVDERNTIEQQLYQINRKNEQRQLTYMQNLKAMAEGGKKEASESGVVPEAQRREELTYAYNNPEEFKKEFEAQIDAEKASRAGREEAFVETLPAETKEILKIIQSYLKAPEQLAGTAYITRNAETLLVRESIEAELSERVRREHETVLESIENNAVKEKRITDRMQSVENHIGRITPETVNLVHKVKDVTISDETIEELRKEIRQVKSDTEHVTNEVTNIDKVVTQQVNNTTEKVVTEVDTDSVVRLVQKSLQDQIGNITNKVYSKIERQLQSERRRRGM